MRRDPVYDTPDRYLSPDSKVACHSLTALDENAALMSKPVALIALSIVSHSSSVGYCRPLAFCFSRTMRFNARTHEWPQRQPPIDRLLCMPKRRKRDKKAETPKQSTSARSRAHPTDRAEPVVPVAPLEVSVDG